MKDMTGQEISGYIDIKVPNKGRKFGQWKAWRRQWCVVQQGPGNIIQMQFGNGQRFPTNCLEVPHNAVLCRSESRSRGFAFGIFSSSSVAKRRRAVVFLAGRSESEAQRWIQKIRSLVSPQIIPVREGEFTVSLIDTSHSRTAGLAGLYGILSTSLTGITISDPTSGQLKVHWRWSQIDNSSLQPPNNTEDDNRICIVHTSREFSCGEGEIHLFCTNAWELEASFSQCQNKRQHRLVTSPLPPTPIFHSHTLPLLSTRRLSRSEGDLRCWPPDSPWAFFHLRSQSVSRTSTASEDDQSSTKVATSLISAGIGLMLSTPGCSEPDSLHDYQCLNPSWSDEMFLSEADYQTLELEDDDLHNMRKNFKRPSFNFNRRESGVSIASGIYEEIQEQPTEYYESISKLMEESLMSPPPLPPRKSELNLTRVEEFKEDTSKNSKTIEEPDYLPMSPRRRLSASQETYVTMANIINITTKPVV